MTHNSGLAKYSLFAKYHYLQLQSIDLNYQQGAGEKNKLISDAIKNGESIPTQYTKYGANEKPDIRWDHVPDGTKAMLLMMYDPDARMVVGHEFIHWLVYDIEMSKNNLIEGRYSEAINDFGEIGYGGPKPPKGKKHMYHFILYFLSKPIGMKKNRYSYDQIMQMVRGSVISTVGIIAPYQHN